MGENINMKIMIIIPAWNEEKSITFSLESILNQTRIPDRIIVVPNNTSDQTIKVATSIDAAVEILEMPGFNKDKKAGAINYALNNLAEVLNLWEPLLHLPSLQLHYIKFCESIRAADMT